MMTKSDIDELSTKLQTNPLVIAREYCQHQFLANLYSQKDASRMLFKGGTELRIIYNSPHFSEDLDFTGVSGLRARDVEELLTQVLSDLALWGFDIDLSEAKETTGGYLGKVDFSFIKLKFIIKVEVSFRQSQKKSKSETTTIKNDYIQMYSIIHQTLDDIVDGKLAALLHRSKPRDWYDVYFLLKSDYLNNKQKELLPEVLAKFKSYRGDLKKELREFLPKNHQLILRDFRQILMKELDKYTK